MGQTRASFLTSVCFSLASLCLSAVGPLATAADATAAADRALADYFAAETRALEERCLADVRTIDDWEAGRSQAREQLLDMFGLDAEALTPASAEQLAAVVTGRLTFAGESGRSGCVVEKLHYQSRPGLYVTANLYLPSDASAEHPCPAVLYLCGHGRVVEDGVSLGNKVHYQHHGAWLAEHGYAVLMIDTLQLGEIEGIHHGTYREGRWWWPSRGYTPAGVEALNGLRGVDYLLTRPEIDPERIGATGRSGGGAGSWWAVALDERVKAAIPVAGITDLRDHVVEGCIKGHCDCMFTVNTYRWDYPQLAALAYPRPLLLANTDQDPIFPLGGVMRTQAQVRRLYTLGGKPDAFGVAITSGGHADTQELQMPAIRWLDAHLGMGPRLIDTAARKRFEPRQLKVFDKLPADERNTRIDREFVPMAGPFDLPASEMAWQEQVATWRAGLLDRTFRGWPEASVAPAATEVASREGRGLIERTYRFESQPNVVLELIAMHHSDGAIPEEVVLEVLDQAGWERLEAARAELFGDQGAALNAEASEFHRRLTEEPLAVVFLAPRGEGPTQWSQDGATHVHNRRRFLLLGQTWEGMQVYDIRRGIQAIRAGLRQTPGLENMPLALKGQGGMAVLSVYASLFEEPLSRIELHDMPASHDAPAEGSDRAAAPALLNVLKTLDVPQAVAIAASRGHVAIHGCDEELVSYASGVAEELGWPSDRLVVHAAPDACAAPLDGVRFEERVLDPHAGEVCYAVTLADVDGDRRDDIVVVTEEAVVWYANPGDTAEAWVKRDMIRGQTPRDNVCIAPHDIDGDGAVDFAIGASWPREGTLHWITRDSDPTKPWKVHDIGPLPSTHRMAWADVLGSGRPQLVVSPLNATAGMPGVELTAFSIPDNPVTDRWLPTVLDRELNRVHGQMHADLDGDGTVDTIAASREGLHLLEKQESGFRKTLVSTAAIAPEPNASGAGEIAWGHFADGTEFLVAVEPMHGSDVAVFTPGGAAAAGWMRGVIDAGYARGHAIATADFDGDGTDEIVFGSSDPSETPGHGPTLAIFRRVAEQSPLVPAGWQREVLDAGGTTVEAVAVGDLTGDGLPEIVAVGRATHNVKLFTATRERSENAARE
jgi:dienelactone hydrolase